MSFFEELKRRNVFRVGIAYVLLGWVVLQAADFALDLVDAPNWIIQVFFIAGLAGLPVALFFAWAFELTPEGIKREEDVDRSASITPTTGRKLDRAIIAFLAVAVVLLLAKDFLSGSTGPELPNSDSKPETTAETVKSIAVLPFADLSQAQDQGWFADGLAEEILNALTRVPDLQVTARTSTFQYRDTTKDVATIGEELGVAHVLEGSVRSAGDRIRVTAQLIRTEDGFHLWSENYDRDVSDMISIQEDLARSIAVALETTMDPEALAEMAAVGTDSIDAYQLYLKGIEQQQFAFATSEGGEEFRKAYEFFEQARAIDPMFSEAHTRSADYWRVEVTPSRTDAGTSGATPIEALNNFNERIGLAIESSRSEADRLLSLADRAQMDLQLQEAKRLYQGYLELRPNDEDARFQLNNVLQMLGDWQTQNEVLERWRQKGQTDAYSATLYVNDAWRSLDPSTAADQGLEWLQRWPNNVSLLYQIHRTLLWAGRNEEATTIARRYVALNPDGNALLKARQACAQGDRATAESFLANFDGDKFTDYSNLWLMHSMLGNTEEAIAVLRPLENKDVPYMLASFLGYRQFDPTPYPELMALLEREGATIREPSRPTYACPPPERTSVAVLAFENMSPDPENEYFADGISEEILNVLTGLSDLRVIARTSAFSFKGSEATIAEIAEKLDVGYVLEGSVRKAGNRVRVTAQLIETGTESHLWSETYDRDLDDIFAVQDEIARAIANELHLQLGEDQSDALVTAPTENIEAYNQYLVGRQLWHQRTGQNLRTSASTLQAAVQMDPNFAQAWAALADALVLIPEYDTRRDISTIPAARDAVNRALELQPNMPQALTTRAYIRFVYDYDWENAEKDFLRAMELDPDYPTAQQWYGEYLSLRYRDVEGALEQARKGAKLDPLAPIMWHVAGLVAQSFGRYEEAMQYYQRALEINPNAQYTYANMSQMFLEKGDYDQARAHLERFWELSDRAPPEGPSIIDALEDPTVRPLYLELLKTTDIVPSGAADKAFHYMLLGEPELAMDDLEHALEQGTPYAIQANANIIYDPLRDDPRFQAHLAKMNLWPPPGTSR